MPQFEVLSRHEAIIRSDTGKRLQVIREYVQHIERLAQDQTERIAPSPVRRWPPSVAVSDLSYKATGKNIQIKRLVGETTFGKKPSQEAR